MSGEKAPMTGARGFAIVMGAMFAIMAVLWVIAAVLAP
jgi:preprotein translocase subunit SecG